MSTDCISSEGAKSLHYPVGCGAEDAGGGEAKAKRRICAVEGHID